MLKETNNGIECERSRISHGVCVPTKTGEGGLVGWSCQALTVCVCDMPGTGPAWIFYETGGWNE